MSQIGDLYHTDVQFSSPLHSLHEIPVETKHQQFVFFCERGGLRLGVCGCANSPKAIPAYSPEDKILSSSLTEENRKSYSPLQRVIVGNKRETGWSPIYCRR